MYNEIEMFDLQNIREKKNLSSVCVCVCVCVLFFIYQDFLKENVLRNGSLLQILTFYCHITPNTLTSEIEAINIYLTVNLFKKLPKKALLNK